MTIGTTRFFGNNSELFSKLNTELQSLQTQAGTGKAELKLANNIGDISKLSAAEEKKSETNQLLSNSQRAQTDLEQEQPFQVSFQQHFQEQPFQVYFEAFQPFLLHHH